MTRTIEEKNNYRLIPFMNTGAKKSKTKRIKSNYKKKHTES